MNLFGLPCSIILNNMCMKWTPTHNQQSIFSTLILTAQSKLLSQKQVYIHMWDEFPALELTGFSDGVEFSSTQVATKFPTLVYKAMS